MVDRRALSECTESIQRGVTPTYSDAGKLRVINQKVIRWATLDLAHARHLDDLSLSERILARQLRCGDVLVNSTGEGTLGRANVWTLEGPGWVADSHVTVVRPDPERLDPFFLKFWIQSPDGQDFISSSKTGATKQTELATRSLRDAPIPCPPMQVQRRIASRIKECMDRLDEVESLRSQSKAETLLLAGSCMEAIEEVGRYPTATVSDLILGTQNGRSIRPDNVNGNGFVLSIRAVHSVSLDVTARKPAVIPEATAKTCSISAGDVFVSRANTMELVGLASVSPDDVPGRTIYPDLLIKLTARRDLCLPRYLAYALRIPGSRRQIQERAVGSSQSMVKISAQRLKEVTIPLPSLKEQERLVETFDEIQLVAARIQEAMRTSEVSSVRASVLRKAFAGEL